MRIVKRANGKYSIRRWVPFRFEYLGKTGRWWRDKPGLRRQFEFPTKQMAENMVRPAKVVKHKWKRINLKSKEKRSWINDREV